MASSFPGLSIFNKDVYALDLLSVVLAGGTSSRLHRALIEEQKIGINVSSWNFTPSDEGLLLFFSSLRPGESTQTYKKAFYNVLSKVKKNGVTLDELKASKKMMKVNSLSSYETLSGKARGLALNEILFKDYKRLFSDMDRYQNVTLAQINEVAKKYLDFNKINHVEVGK